MSILREGILPLDTRLLISYMRSLSEDLHQASWITNLEYDLWNLMVRNKASEEWPLTHQEIADLRTLFERAQVWPRFRHLNEILPEFGYNSWVDVDEEDLFIPPDRWYQLYTEDEWNAHLIEQLL